MAKAAVFESTTDAETCWLQVTTQGQSAAQPQHGQSDVAPPLGLLHSEKEIWKEAAMPTQSGNVSPHATVQAHV